MTLKCPNDGTVLTSISIENVPIDQCPVCSGMWLQRGELETLGEHHGKHLVPITIGEVSVIDSKRRCPQDGEQLCQHEFADHSGIIIDQCPTCQGIWLEQTELSGILSYLDSDGADVPTEPTLSQKVMLFLYQLVRQPPYV